MGKSKLCVRVLTFAILALGVSFAALAADREIRGTVTSIDGQNDTVIIRLDDGTTKTFKYASTLDVLNIGNDDYVVVRYNEDASGNFVALEVDETERTAAVAELPRTGSPLPFLTLVGLGSFLGGLALRLNRNKR